MRPAIMIGAAVGLLVVVIAVVLHVSHKQVNACSYPAIPLERIIEDADFIFRGQVLSIDSLRISSDEFEDIVEFKAIEVWKGEPYETMYVRSSWKFLTREDLQAPCPPSLNHQYTIGLEYLVIVKGGQANVGSDTVTQNIASADLYLEELGAGKPPTLGSVGPIPERKGQPFEVQPAEIQPVEVQPGSGCGLTNGNASGSINLSAIGLTVMLAWFWLRQRFRR